MALPVTDIDRIVQLGNARHVAIQALADIDAELRDLITTAVRTGVAPPLLAELAEIPRTLLDRWIDEARQ